MQSVSSCENSNYVKIFGGDFANWCTDVVKYSLQSKIDEFRRKGFITSKTINVTNDVVVVRIFGKKTDVITFRFKRFGKQNNTFVDFTFDVNVACCDYYFLFVILREVIDEVRINNQDIFALFKR